MAQRIIDFMNSGYMFWSKQCGLKAVIRLFHTGVCCAITATLLAKDTKLRWAVVEKQDLVYGGCFLCLVFISLCLYFITSLTDPGYVDVQQYSQTSTELEDGVTSESDHSDTEVVLDASEPLAKRNRYKYRYCDYCEIKPPLRSKHCKDCKMCVRKYDHHCPWLETCVGERNHKFFWWFLFLTSMLIVWVFVIVWEAFVTQETWSEWFHKNLVLFLDMVVLVWGGPVCLGLLIFHTYLMTSGLTTWETASRQRITYLKYLDEETNPFDDGCAVNVYYFMCYYKIKTWEAQYTKKAKFKVFEA